MTLRMPIYLYNGTSPYTLNVRFQNPPPGYLSLERFIFLTSGLCNPETKRNKGSSIFTIFQNLVTLQNDPNEFPEFSKFSIFAIL